MLCIQTVCSHLRRMGKWPNIRTQMVVTETDGDLPNPNSFQTLLITFRRNPSTYGMIRERESIARAQRSKLLALASRWRLESTKATVPRLEKATRPHRQLLMVAEIKCCPYLLSSSHMQSAMWTSHFILIELRAGLVNFGFFAWSYSDLLTWTARRSWISPCRKTVFCSFPRRFFQTLRPCGR